MGKIDFVAHAIAFSDKDQLDGRYLETTADNFTKTMLISTSKYGFQCGYGFDIRF
jgi:enoyl-[acyl-carrier-protein] reductase (NADH)